MKYYLLGIIVDFFDSMGYHLGNRIVFYLSRMISSHKLTEFYQSDYDNM